MYRRVENIGNENIETRGTQEINEIRNSNRKKDEEITDREKEHNSNLVKTQEIEKKDIYDKAGKNRLGISETEAQHENRRKYTKTIQNKDITIGKEKIQIGLINVNGMNMDTWPDIDEEAKQNNYDLLALTETHMRNDYTWEGQHYKMEGKGRTKNDRKGGGIALMTLKNKNWKINIIEEGNQIEHEDIVTYRVENTKIKKMKLIIIVCYMSTGETPERITENKKKYERVGMILNKFKNEQIIVMGDMNAHTGILGEKVDKNGELLLTLAENYNLEIGNLTIAEGRITWRRPSGTEKSAIDYILFNQIERERITRMKIDEEGAVDIKSDHNVITLHYEMNRENFRDKKRCLEKTWNRKNVNWNAFKEKIGEERKINGDNKEELQEKLNILLKWSAEKTIGYKKTESKGKYRPWWNSDIKTKRNERREANRKRKKLESDRDNGGIIDESVIVEARKEYEHKKNRSKRYN